jgi:hypothetical protein
MTEASQPTEAEVYASYQLLLDGLNKLFFATKDPADLRILGDLAQSVSDILTENNEVHLEANSGIFLKLTPPMVAANKKLQEDKKAVAAIIDKVGDVGKAAEALTKVLELTAKFA